MAAGLKDLGKRATQGARRVIATENLATVGGLAASRIVERTVYQAARETFGTNDGVTVLTPAQRTARVLANAAIAVVAGAVIVTAPDKHVRAAGLGLMVGATWHAINNLGINV